MTAERITNFRPRDPRQVPPSADAITPEWLTAVLCSGVPGAQVLSVRADNGSDGTTTRREIKVEYNELGANAGLPRRLFSKATTGLKTRLMLCPIGRVENDVHFYKEFRPQLDIEAPTAVYAGYHHLSGRSMILMQDLAETTGARFLDPTHAVTRQQAEDMVSLIASYQATFWNSPQLDNKSRWLRTTLDYQLGANASIPFQINSMVGIDRASEVLPEALVQRKGELWDAHMASVVLSARAPYTLTHWDMHIGNWYLTAKGRMGLLDWSVKRGHWGADVTYAMVSALTVSDRREWERDLLALYRERLASGGVKDVPSSGEVWFEYRRQTFHPFFFWATTMGAGRMQPNMQPNSICLANLQRMGQAIVDLESLEAIGQA